MTKDEICGLLRQIHDVLAMQSETNHWAKPVAEQEPMAHKDWCASLTQLLLSNPPKPAPCNCTPPTPQRTEPVCPECKAGVLYECVACSSNNYPPQRTWVRLTDREIEECWDGDLSPYQMQCIREIEAKLRELNI
jgi:hypothetical protein